MSGMTYQFPVTAWRPGAKSSTAKPEINQSEFEATIADALIAPARGLWRKPSQSSTREMLEAEMLALEAMGGLIADPRFAGEQSQELVAETKRLIQLVGSLADRASSLPELVDTRAA